MEELGTIPISRYEKVRLKIFEYKGGKCEVCEVVAAPALYDLHHRDPNDKSFQIGRNYTIKWERLVVELDKCMYLCPNCHRQEHIRMRDDKSKDKTTE